MQDKMADAVAQPPGELGGTVVMTDKSTSGETPSRAEEEPDATASLWDALELVELNQKRLARRRIVTFARKDPASEAFDILRTKLLQVLKQNGWSRVAITSPTPGCGKTFTAANLAFSLSRHASFRTVLIDFDLRIPNLANTLGIQSPGNMADFLTGERSIRDHMVRVAPNLALATNDGPSPNPSELLQAPETLELIARIKSELAADVMLFDLPEALSVDDVRGFLPHVDGVLLVAGGGTSSADEIRKAEAVLGDAAPLIGVVLNRSEDVQPEPYG